MKCDEKNTLKGGRQCSTYRFIVLHKSIKLAQIAFIMHVVVVLATISNVMVPTFEEPTGWLANHLFHDLPGLLLLCPFYLIVSFTRVCSRTDLLCCHRRFVNAMILLHLTSCFSVFTSCKQGFWVALGPCVHKSLQFVSLCEYDFVRNGFGVYHRFANQLWSFQ